MSGRKRKKEENKPKIYDCFTFFNELDILKLRLQELYDSVDRFVLVEANKTHSGEDKEFIFENNKDRFKEYLDKIIHIKVKDMPKINKIGEYTQKIGKGIDPYSPIPLNGLIIHLGIGRWKPEKYQRNQIKRGLKNCNDEDIIMVSDLDEIPNKKKFNIMKEKLGEYKRVLFKQKYYSYYLNGFVKKGWKGTKACKFKTLKEDLENEPQKIRHSFWDSQFINKFKNTEINTYSIKNGGWHFSYLGDVDKITKKISSIAHAERDKKSFKEQVKEKIERGEYLLEKGHKITYVKIDKSFPKALRENKEEYKDFIKNE